MLPVDWSFRSLCSGGSAEAEMVRLHSFVLSAKIQSRWVAAFQYKNNDVAVHADWRIMNDGLCSEKKCFEAIAWMLTLLATVFEGKQINQVPALLALGFSIP